MGDKEALMPIVDRLDEFVPFAAQKQQRQQQQQQRQQRIGGQKSVGNKPPTPQKPVWNAKKPSWQNRLKKRVLGIKKKYIGAAVRQNTAMVKKSMAAKPAGSSAPRTPGATSVAGAAGTNSGVRESLELLRSLVASRIR